MPMDLDRFDVDALLDELDRNSDRWDDVNCVNPLQM